MKTIHRLSDRLIAQIAAGEIIERPVFAVKELIDNAIDAQADDIRIDVTEFGLQSIRVTDNGTGMNEEDILECYKLHTTSKVGDKDVFFGIRTLGFRGEALASIAAVSQLTIESKQPHQLSGKKITLFKNELINVQSIGMPSGTRVIITDLFGDIPVRKKFISRKRQELKKILDMVTAYAISHPHISFDVNHNGRTLFSARSQNIDQRIDHIFGTPQASHLFPFSFKNRYITIEGFLSSPQLSATSLPFQYLSINRRPVVEKNIQSLLKHAYGILLESERQPCYILNFSIEPSYVDINIHPQKQYVAILDSDTVLKDLLPSITSHLSQYNLSFEGLPEIRDHDEKLTYTPLAKQLKKNVLPKKEIQMTQRRKSNQILQIHNLYIAYETTNGFVIVDQHAAHERILYEEYVRAFLKEKQKNLSEFTKDRLFVELSEQEYKLWEIYQDDLSTIGFTTEEYRSTTILIHSYPAIFSQRNMNNLFKNLLKDMNSDQLHNEIDNDSKKLLAYLACRSAVKSGDPLTIDQMNTIIKDLEAIPLAYTCPHGRPVKYTISLSQLHKLFKRI